MIIIRVNMKTGVVKQREISPELMNLGGRALTAQIIKNEIPPRCDPLGEENKLIFAPGLLSGTSMFNTSRISVGGKSPLTGTIKESNAGGTISSALGRIGIAAVIIENQANKGEIYNLIIQKNGECFLREASEYRGSRTYAFTKSMFDKYGKHNGILCIGPAGEKKLLSASIQFTDLDGHPCRAAARGGLGAVMGSKGLKSIIVDLSCKTLRAVNDVKIFEKAISVFSKAVKAHPFCGEELPTLGTAGTIEVVNSIGALSSYNSTIGVFDKIANVSGENMARIINERGGQVGHKGCSQCIANCSNVFVDKQGNYTTSSLEFETIWAMGPMTGVDDLDVIAKMDFMSDDLGIDTMNTGVAFAVAMDAGYKEFGDKEGLLEMMDEIAQFSDFGIVLGNGPAAVGEFFNHHRVPCVKKQSIAAYDPRAMQGNGVTYATSPMGADHTAGNLLGLNLSGKLNPLKAEGQIAASRYAQIEMTLLDSMGLCHFVRSPLVEPKIKAAFTTIINAKLGTFYSYEDLLSIAEKTLRIELEFNSLAGINAADNRLPEFFSTEPLLPHNVVFSVKSSDLDQIFNEVVTVSLKIHKNQGELTDGEGNSGERRKLEFPKNSSIKDLFKSLGIITAKNRAVINKATLEDEYIITEDVAIDIFPQTSRG